MRIYSLNNVSYDDLKERYPGKFNIEGLDDLYYVFPNHYAVTVRNNQWTDGQYEVNLLEMDPPDDLTALGIDLPEGPADFVRNGIRYYNDISGVNQRLREIESMPDAW